jgi:plastocyanin
VGILLLALWLTRVSRLRSLAAGGVVLIVIAVMGMSTVGTVGVRVPWGAPYYHHGPSGMVFWFPVDWRGSSRPPWTITPLPGSLTLRLRMIDFAFRPSVIAAPPGVPLNLELINSGEVAHTLVIPVLGVRTMLMPGERRIIDVGGVEPGTYEFFCAMPAHREAGMIGRLVVGPGN